MQEFRHESTGVIQREFSQAINEVQLVEKMNLLQSEMEEKGFTETRRVKIGRNDICPCGSGKKFKKCHLNSAK